MSAPAETPGARFRSSSLLALTALVIYLFGGLFTFGGLVLSVRRWFSHGPSGLSSGILMVVVGISLSMLGVLFMRIVRNRGRR
jgi:hypothetical protein